MNRPAKPHRTALEAVAAHGAGVGAGRGYGGFCGAAKPFNIEPNPARLHARASAQKSPARWGGGAGGKL